MKLHRRLKQTLALILATSSFVSATPVFAIDYTGHWAEQAIEKWKEKGILNGYEDGSFKPKQNVTRAEFAKILSELLGLIVTEKAETFEDIKGEEWYAKYIELVSSAGYMKGIDGNFRPNAYITREEAAYAIATAYHMTGETDKIFTDEEDISTWAASAIKALVAANCITGYPDGSLKPQGNLTRAEAVAMLDKITAEIINVPGTYTQDIHGNLVINQQDVNLKDMTIDGNLYLAEGIGEGDVTLENVKVLGTTVVEGGGVHSIKLFKSEINHIIIHKELNPVRIVTDEHSKIPQVLVASPAVLEGQLEAVKILTPEEVKIANAKVSEVHILEEKAKVVLHEEALVEKLVANASSEVVVEGTLKEAVVNADEVIFYKKPEKLEILPGVQDPIIIETPTENPADTPSSVPKPPSSEDNTTDTIQPVVVTSIEIVTPPNKTIYTEGETLDLTGLQIKLTKSNQSNEVVALQDFAKKGLIVNPAQGSILTLEHTQVEILHSSSGNKATQIILVSEHTQTDQQAPVLVYDGETSITVEAGQDFIIPTVTATDNLDQQVLVNWEIKNSQGSVVNTIDTNVSGTYTITYTAQDKAGNDAVPLTITVTVADTTAPVLHYDRETLITIEAGQDFTIPTVTATDNFDQQVQVNWEIKNPQGTVVSTIDTNVLGTYIITYTAQDSAGNTATPLEITVTVVDTIAPVLHYDGETSINIEAGQDFTIPTVTATDNLDQEVQVLCEIKNTEGSVISAIDTNVLGTYTITYTAQDKAGNTAIPLELVVNISPKKIKVADIKVTNETEITFTTPTDYPDLVIKWNGKEVVSAIEKDSSGTKVTCTVQDMRQLNTLEVSSEGYTTYIEEDIVPDFDWKASADITWYKADQSTFYISTASQLAGLAQLVNSGQDSFSRKTIELSNNIDLLGLEWEPIGGPNSDSGPFGGDPAFCGKFNGNGHVISNLSITKNPKNKMGLFGEVQGVTISDVKLENVSLDGKNYVGALVGCATGNISGCSVSNATIKAGSFVGGLIGYGYTNVDSCRANNPIIEGSQNIGGIVGFIGESSYIIKRCVVEGISLKASYKEGGGIIGANNSSTSQIIECKVVGSGNTLNGGNAIGGIVGSVWSGITIENCYVYREGLIIYAKGILQPTLKGWYAGAKKEQNFIFGRPAGTKEVELNSGDIIFKSNLVGDCTFEGNSITNTLLEQDFSIIEETRQPEDNSEITQDPEITQDAEGTEDSEITLNPEANKDPEIIQDCEANKDSEITLDPEANKDPEITLDTEATQNPEINQAPQLEEDELSLLD